MTTENMECKQKMTRIWNEVAESFGKVGPSYWDYFGSRLVELAKIQAGAVVLDIGMGRGASLFPAAVKVGSTGTVIGIDLAEGMVEETQKEILRRGIQNSRVMVMDAEHLDFADSSFDNVLCGFGIANLLYSDSKFDGILRVLKPGGQVGFSIWGVQKDTPWITSLINNFLYPDQVEEDTQQTNVPDHITVTGIQGILEEAGFWNVFVREEQKMVCYKDKEEWWAEMWLNAGRFFLEQINLLGDGYLEKFKAEAFEGLENYRNDDKIQFTRVVIYAFGEK